MAKTLYQILDENGWNGPDGTDKNTDHDYINAFYEEEFKKYKNKKIDILEIGTCRGTSAHLWQKYFPKANIISIDINNYLQERHKEIPRVQYLLMNGYSEDTANFLPEFDIIIDDGTHSLQDQISCLKFYVPKLKNGGILVIEDIQEESFFSILSDNVLSNDSLSIEFLDIRKNKGRSDDMMFIVRKK